MRGLSIAFLFLFGCGGGSGFTDAERAVLPGDGGEIGAGGLLEQPTSGGSSAEPFEAGSGGAATHQTAGGGGVAPTSAGTGGTPAVSMAGSATAGSGVGGSGATAGNGGSAPTAGTATGGAGGNEPINACEAAPCEYRPAFNVCNCKVTASHCGEPAAGECWQVELAPYESGFSESRSPLCALDWTADCAAADAAIDAQCCQ